MQTEGTSLSDDSDTTEVLKHNDVGGDADLQRSSLSDVDTHSARGSVEEDVDVVDHSAVDFVSNVTETVIAVAALIGNDVGDGEEDSDSSLDSATVMHVGYFDNEEDAERNLHRLNEFVNTYKTRYTSTFRVGKEYCVDHIKTAATALSSSDTKTTS
ncbi:hypothetical protein F443_14932 [Phytophthora nicotianae P1569]|uniref:Uncharacterized protein n=1 Tax=Phytophthora nicotianae P1569 TaxID=1317065 RepID=V9ELU6_PHYNI|nr:hypothetical protein F443_14932 [Phytophthora nicotianae P1569]